MLGFLNGFFTKDIGIDLGTSNTLIYERDQGIVLDEPSVVAIDAETREVLAVGLEAKRMIGRAPANIIPVRPLHDGVIAEFELAEELLRRFFLATIKGSWFLKPRVIICAPTGVTPVERKAVREVAEQAGARESYIIDELMAAAIGAGLPVNEALGSMIVDIGAGTTEVGVISLGSCVFVNCIRLAGDSLDDAVRNYMKKQYSFLIGDSTAELVKKNLGYAGLADGSNVPSDREVKKSEVSGRDLVSGLPRKVSVSENEIMEAMTEPLSQIVDAVKESLEKTPPELASDIAEKGITLSGGGALIRDLDKLISKATNLDVRVAESPLTSVVRGTAVALEELETLAKISQ